MDGDRMGKLLRSDGKKVGKALAHFTKKVDGIVKSHDGILVYAGGDDVLAMLPRPRAIGCAHALSNEFELAFRKENIDATISAGLVFASYRVPLRSVMQEAHSILDDIAKEENNRGSLAISVLKGSGKYCQWVSDWKGLLQNGGIVPEEIAKSLKEEKDLSISFFYRMRELLVMLSGESCWRPGMFFELKGDLQEIDIERILLAEYLNAYEHTTEIDSSIREKVEMSMERLLTVSKRHKRIEDPKELIHQTPAFGADGLL